VIPAEFYAEADATQAIAMAEAVITLVGKFLEPAQTDTEEIP
jgi:HEPN domain-containing protein